MNFSKINLILTVVFILAVIVLGWVLFKSNNQKRPTASINNQAIDRATMSPTDTLPTIPPFERAISADTVENLKNIKKGILTSSTLTNTYSGKVSRVSTQGGFLPWANNFKFKLMLVVQNSKGDSNDFYYSQETLNKNSIDTESFRVGDNITIIETKNLQLPIDQSIIKLKITKS